ncbi:unnamed protein product [Chrysoparadoxa australica]
MKFIVAAASALCVCMTAEAFVGPQMMQMQHDSIQRRDLIQTVGAGVLGAGVLASASGPALAAAAPGVGTKAPDFDLPSNTGSNVSLKQLTSSGKTTVLYFYPGDFTSGCTIEAQGFQKDIAKYKALNAQIVGVSVDSAEKHLDFTKSYGLDFTLLSDNGATVADAYGSKLEVPFLGKFANRVTFIIDKEGIIKKVFTDVEGKVRQHSADVLAAL